MFRLRLLGRFLDAASPWIAIGLIGIAFLRIGDTNGRVTEVKHTIEQRVELCSTSVSCHGLLEKLIASLTPREVVRIRRDLSGRTVPRKRSLPVIARELARKHAQTHSRRHRPSGRTESHARPPTVHSPPVVAPVLAPPAPVVVPPVPEVPTPHEPPGHGGEPPGQAKKKEGPLGLPCVELPVVERLLCHAKGH